MYKSKDLEYEQDSLSHQTESDDMLLPKNSSEEIPALLGNIIRSESSSDNEKTVDLVILDDDRDFTYSFIRYVNATSNKTVDKYECYKELLNSLSKYSKNVKIIMDYQFRRESITGVEVAMQLYQQGFSNLYLFSGKIFSSDDSIPAYLNTILKTDIQALNHLLSE